jgi:aspartate 1-decarboxylase
MKTVIASINSTNLLLGRDLQSRIRTRREKMQRIMLRAKLHRVTVTEADLEYEGSCGIDEDLLDAANMREYEKIELYNINNGERFSTYIIKAARGSGAISLNGAAARKAHVGDLLIICTYGLMNESDAAAYIPKVILVDDKNKIKEIKKITL